MTVTLFAGPDRGRVIPVRRYLPWVAGVVAVGVMAILPWVGWTVPWILPGKTNTPGTLQVLGVALLISSLALSYHLLFGVARLLSFGHSLYFAAGVYGLAILLDRIELPLLVAAGFTIAGTTVLAAVVGAICLRVSGISFAMVTLAFAQAGNVLVRRNPQRATGGEEGLSLESDHLPEQFLGVFNTRFLYWLALAIVVLVFAVVAWVEHSRAGHVAAAARENELRVKVIGLRPYVVRFVIFVVAAVLASIAGIGYVLLQSGASPRVTSADFTLTLLVMVVLGGVGARWGALVGAMAYTLLDQRLGALASSDTIAALPAVLRVPLSQPLFILGVLFILVVLFLPRGIAGQLSRFGVSPHLDVDVDGTVDVARDAD